MPLTENRSLSESPIGTPPACAITPISAATDPHDQFLQFFLKHESDLRAFIGSLVRDRHLRDDVLQEVALVLWKQFDQYDRTRSFGAWARGIATHKIMQRWEREARWPAAFSPEAMQSILAAFDRTETTAHPKAEALHLCVDGLPEKSRTLLQLRYEQRLTPEAIATKVEGSLAAVYKSLSRIRLRLEECIERRLAAERRGA